MAVIYTEKKTLFPREDISTYEAIQKEYLRVIAEKAATYPPDAVYSYELRSVTLDDGRTEIEITIKDGPGMDLGAFVIAVVFIFAVWYAFINMT